MSLQWMRKFGTTAMDMAQGRRGQAPEPNARTERGQASAGPAYPTFGYDGGNQNAPPPYSAHAPPPAHASAASPTPSAPPQDSHGYAQYGGPPAPASYSQPQHSAAFPQPPIQQQPQAQSGKPSQAPAHQAYPMNGGNQAPPPQQAYPSRPHHHSDRDYVHSGTKRSAIATTLGFDGLIWWCLEQAAIQKPAEQYSSDDCCAWTCADLCSQSLRYNLCCPCIYCLGVAGRVFVGIFAGIFLMVAFVFLALAHFFPVIFYLYKSLVVKSPQLGIFLKICIALVGIPVLAALSLATLPLIALFVGPFVLVSYTPHRALDVIMGGVGVYFGRGLVAKKDMYALYEIEGPFTELKIFYAFLALIYMCLGLVICGVSFMFMKMAAFPQLLWVMLKDVWSTFDVGTRPTQHTSEDPWPCELCFNCCMNSVMQFCSLCSFPFRLLASLFVFILLILGWPMALLYGMFVGIGAGASVYSEPHGALNCAPFGKAIKEFYRELDHAIHGSDASRSALNSSA